MSLDNQSIYTIAHLSRLNIDEQELNNYRNDLSNILDLVTQMQTCDTTDVQPMTHPFDATLRLRDDEVSETDQRDKFHSIAPSVANGVYLVPKVLE